MDIRVYGKLDADPALYNALMEFVDLHQVKSLVIAAHQRVPLGARHCQRPGSLKYEFVMDGKAGLARQEADGRIKCKLAGVR